MQTVNQTIVRAVARGRTGAYRPFAALGRAQELAAIQIETGVRLCDHADTAAWAQAAYSAARDALAAEASAESESDGQAAQ